ncbi:putative O-glycosylation ligase, exosortase A system-associated [Rhizomicrobium electricum]|uniref:O-glycosylation ligase, exosortase A system-associated n=1 Tax=Rhizomicrobium electricum TaxID=480070 RepID=A0ABP3PNW9_9PROT|nr:putative O-glycosylation ligase, exosortase A system-associated [Rhizomicrobium electricum]NIJ46901.1 putative O-glycosylation ligase (exosortase A-associated) [Rhizomicrobium electricum]
MREILLVIAILAGLGMTLRWPFVGVLIWEWFTLQNPHRETYGFVGSANMVIALVTLVAWAMSKERKAPPNGFILWGVIIFIVWTTIGTFFAYDPEWSFGYWDRTWKTFALGILLAATVTNRVRVQAVIWVAVISLFYYGVKGGLFTIVTGGHNHVLGPSGTMINDNNQLAVAMLMTLPLANYLRGQSLDKWVRLGLLSGIILTVIAVIGTYSRGALIGLATLGFLGLLRMKRRLTYIAVASVLIAFTAHFMPAQYFDRMSTMNSVASVQEDQSFHGRIVAWKVAFNAAKDRFPFGAGFYGPQLAPLFHSYFPNEKNHAAHSIYFQVLGEHGFIGLGIYLLLIAASFFRVSRIIRAARRVGEQRWVAELGVALQASLIVFCVSGAALSLAYYDLFVIDICLMLPLWEMVRPKRTQPAWRAVPIGATG